MSFRQGPAYTHGQPLRTAVRFVNLGSDEATAPALRRYLARSSLPTRGGGNP